MEFDAKELAQATKNYCRASLIGRGGFGVVYKGSLRYCVTAIKVLTKVSFGMLGRYLLKS